MPKSFTMTGSTEAAPRAAFRAIKEKVLGKSYRLSLAFVTPGVIKKWNKIYRGKNYPTDILSFPLSKKEGEIYISPAIAKKESKKFGESENNFILLLFIHGLVHLKGHDHGATMERIERITKRKFISYFREAKK